MALTAMAVTAAISSDHFLSINKKKIFVAAQHDGIAAHQQMGDLDLGKCYLLLGLVLNSVYSVILRKRNLF